MSEPAGNYTLPLFTDLPPPARPNRAPGNCRAPALGQDSFYNTTGERGDQLAEYRQQAKSQEAVITEFFRRHPGVGYGPSQLCMLLPNSPPTSPRRAMTNLTKAGVLIKTNDKRLGIHGRPEHKWILNPAWRPKE